MTVPDFMVTDAKLDWKGEGAVIAAGFWGNHWEILPETSYFQ